MANYDNKLGEWFKQVEQQEQALKAKKTGDTREEPTPVVTDTQAAPPISKLEIAGPAREAPASVVATVETVGVVADTTLAGPANEEQPSVEQTESAARLFAEAEVPAVEDFFSFLNRSSEQAVVEEVEERVFELPKEPTRLSVSEGTGEPRPFTPVSASPAPAAETPQVNAEVEMELPLDSASSPAVEDRLSPAVEDRPTPLVEDKPTPLVEDKPTPLVEDKPAPVVENRPEPAADAGVQANWDRMPRHLQTLFTASSKEIAQHSYKAFRETREDLIQRLLDPTVSLEEAARILNVCPTTVRRYTNRGALKHFRTAGNQRRFRLSDVLAFMEGGQVKAEPDAAGDQA